MRNRSLLVLCLLCFASSIGHAQADDDLPPPPALNLRPPPPPLDPFQKRRRISLITGLLLTGGGIVGVALAGRAISQNDVGDPTSARNFGAGLAGITIGSSAIGVGAGLAFYGITSTPLAGHNSRHKRVAGAVLTALGGALTLASMGVAAMSASECANDDDGLCFSYGEIISTTMSVFAATFFAAGVPLIAIGMDERRDGLPLVRIDSLGPISLPNGGGVGISGHF